MKKLLSVFTLVAVCISLTACAHKHTFEAATCTAPKTCTECGETEGEALKHSTTLGKCLRCGEIINSEAISAIEERVEKLNNRRKDAEEYMEKANDYLKKLDSTNYDKYREKSMSETKYMTNELRALLSYSEEYPEIIDDNVVAKIEKLIKDIESVKNIDQFCYGRVDGLVDFDAISYDCFTIWKDIDEKISNLK